MNATPEQDEKRLALVEKLEEDSEEEGLNEKQKAAKRRRLCDHAMEAMDSVVDVEQELQ